MRNLEHKLIQLWDLVKIPNVRKSPYDRLDDYERRFHQYLRKSTFWGKLGTWIFFSQILKSILLLMAMFVLEEKYMAKAVFLYITFSTLVILLSYFIMRKMDTQLVAKYNKKRHQKFYHKDEVIDSRIEYLVEKIRSHYSDEEFKKKKSYKLKAIKQYLERKKRELIIACSFAITFLSGGIFFLLSKPFNLEQKIIMILLVGISALLVYVSIDVNTVNCSKAIRLRRLQKILEAQF